MTAVSPELSGRRALVTGASMGIGAATVRRLAEHGADVVFCSRSQENLDTVAGSMDGLPGQVFPVAADLSTVSGASRLCDALDNAGQTIDILVNNLGRAPIRDFVETTDEQWAELFRVNLFNAVHITRRVLPHMISQHWGRIIMIASVAAHDPNPALIDYSASKAALLAMATGLARKYGHANVLVNTLSPGGVLTPLAEQTAKDAMARGEAGSVDEFHSRQASGVPLRRFAKPSEMADVVVFLSSSKADYITGTEICADGGWPPNCLGSGH